MTAKGIAFFMLLGSLISNPLFGQNTVYPLVHDEVHHVPIFENDQIRVLDVRASNGDTTDLHQHCNPILYITIKGATVSLKEPNGEWKQVVLPTNWIGQDIYKNDSCFVHQFAVASEEGLQIVAVEALSNTNFDFLPVKPVYQDEGFSLYEVGIAQLVEVIEYDIPIILIESTCADHCKLQVTTSRELSSKSLKENRAYAVSYLKSVLEKF